MVEVCSIASGSNGNCYYVGDQEEAILVDVGINCKQILLRMEERKLDPAKIKAIFITHEHIDHVRGARVLSGKLKVPVFLTRGTYNSLTRGYRPEVYRFVSSGMPIAIGTLVVHPFLKSHDATEPCSFRVEISGHSIGVITDLGMNGPLVSEQINQCQILFLESNYDEKRLWDGPYPWPLKKRIASDLGHLSNMQAAQIIEHHAGNVLDTLFLSHLSAENNTPELAAKAFHRVAEKYKVIVTSRYEAGEVYRFG